MIEKELEILKKKLKKRYKERKIFFNFTLHLLEFVIFLTGVFYILNLFSYNFKNLSEIKIFGKVYENQFVFLTNFFAILIVIIAIFSIIKAIKICLDTLNFETIYRNLIKKLIEDNYKNSNYIPEEFINPQILKEKNMVNNFNVEYGSNLFIFNKNNKLYSSCNIDLKYHSSSKDHNYTKDIFKGQLYTLKSNINIPCKIRIVTSKNIEIINKDINFKFPIKKDETMVNFENVSFNKNFQVYVTNNHYAFYALNPKLMESLLKFKENYKEFEICIEENNILYLIPNEDKILDLPNNKEKIENLSINSILKEIEENFKFIENLEEIFNS